MQLRLRPARAEDRKDVVALLEAEELEAHFEPNEFHVAEIDGRVVACARLKPLPDGSHELASVAVRETVRGTGVGARLVGAVLAAAPRDVHALALAPGFFERQGFRARDDVPALLREKADGLCASSGFVPMTFQKP